MEGSLTAEDAEKWVASGSGNHRTQQQVLATVSTSTTIGIVTSNANIADRSNKIAVSQRRPGCKGRLGQTPVKRSTRSRTKRTVGNSYLPCFP